MISLSSAGLWGPSASRGPRSSLRLAWVIVMCSRSFTLRKSCRGGHRGQLFETLPHRLGNGNDAQARDAQEVPAGEGGVGFDLVERHRAIQLSLRLEVNDDLAVVAGVRIGIGGISHFGDADGLALVAGMVDEGEV